MTNFDAGKMAEFGVNIAKLALGTALINQTRQNESKNVELENEKVENELQETGELVDDTGDITGSVPKEEASTGEKLAEFIKEHPEVFMGVIGKMATEMTPGALEKGFEVGQKIGETMEDSSFGAVKAAFEAAKNGEAINELLGNKTDE